MIQKAGAVNVDTWCGDFLRTDVTHARFNEVCLTSPAEFN